MDEWRNTTLGSILTLQRGFDLPTGEREDGPYPVVASTGIVGTHSKAKVSGPGVVIGRSGSIGGGQYIEKHFWPLNTTLWVKDFKGNDIRFCYYLLKSLDLADFNAGGAVPTLNRNHIHPMPVRVPNDVHEQRAIANLLSALDDKIDLNRRTNETLEAMARAIFKDWFVNFGPTRAKAEGREPYLAREIWDLFPDVLDDEDKPVGWDVESVYDQAIWVNGAAYKNMHFTQDPDALPVVKIAELKAGVTKNTKFTRSKLGDKYRISNGELLFSWSGNPDTSIDTFIWTGGAAWLNQHIFAVRQIGKRSIPFLYYMLKWLKPEFAEIARNKQTTGLGHVTKQDLTRLTVCTGKPDILAAFDDISRPIYLQNYSNLIESRTLAQTRDLLLPKLMSGEIRLRDAEKAVEAVA